VSHGVKITNVISHSSLACPVDIKLAAVALKGRFGSAFPACVGHCRITNTTQSVFDSGKLVVVGAKDEQTALQAAYLYAFTLRRVLNLPVNIFNFVINNVVGYFQLGYDLNLDLFLDDHGLSAQWDPDNFKGLSFKPYGPAKGNISFVLFESGKIIETGGKSTAQLHEAYADQVTLFKKYEVGKEYRQVDDHARRSRPWFAKKAQNKKQKAKR
jgi:transcription initiation factor TFIID TATA-box-binding protein